VTPAAPVLLVSDVHLVPGAPERNAAFFRFLDLDCSALYIIGDLFDYWIGPRHLEFPDYRTELAAIRRKSERCPVFFIKGNRDYLVESRFEKATGAKILGDGARLELGGRTVELAHGDFIYNTNPKYAAYRTMMRSRPIEALWLQMPASVGRLLVRGFRKVSPRTTPYHAWTDEELLQRARRFFGRGADVLIAGHIHRPTHLRESFRGRERELFILGDWCGGTQDYVAWNGSTFELRPWPAA
jgi:UDP-2,3-diacylglucosamine hydrolase